MRYITKQAYINGLAARGVLRNRVMQKMAEESTVMGKPTEYSSPASGSGEPVATVPSPATTTEGKPADEKPLSEEDLKKEIEKQKWRRSYLKHPWVLPESGYLMPGLTGAGVGGIIGALVQAARQKSLLTGALVGAGVGGLTGVGGKYVNDSYIYPKILKAYQDSPVGLADEGITNSVDAPNGPYNEQVA